MAKDVDLGKHSESEIKSICDPQGGTCWSNAEIYWVFKSLHGRNMRCHLHQE